MAPAPSHIPIEVSCSRIREHQHRERMPSGVVFWDRTERNAVVIVRQSERRQEFEGGRRPTTGRSGIKGDMNRQTIQELDEIMRTERWISSVGKESMILLFDSSNLRRRLPFYGGIFQFWTTKGNLHTEEQRNRVIPKAVDENSKKFNKNKTVSQQGITISWHHTFFLIRIIFLFLQFVCDCHLWAFLLSSG